MVRRRWGPPEPAAPRAARHSRAHREGREHPEAGRAEAVGEAGATAQGHLQVLEVIQAQGHQQLQGARPQGPLEMFFSEGAPGACGPGVLGTGAV